MSVHVLCISRPLSPTHKSMYWMCTSSVFSANGPLKISLMCCSNFFHASGKLVESQSIVGGGMPLKSILTPCIDSWTRDGVVHTTFYSADMLCEGPLPARRAEALHSCRDWEKYKVTRVQHIDSRKLTLYIMLHLPLLVKICKCSCIRLMSVRGNTVEWWCPFVVCSLSL